MEGGWDWPDGQQVSPLRARSGAQYSEHCSGLDSGIKLRPFKKDLDIIGDDFRKRWLEYYAASPDKAVMWLGSVALYVTEAKYPLYSTCPLTCGSQ